MEKRPLKNTSLELSAVGMGGAHIQKNQVYAYGARVSEAASIEAVHFAIDSGINFIDTAPLYSDSEEVLGRAMEGRRHQVVLSTKVGCFRGINDDSRDGAWRSIEQSLSRLKTDHVEILFLHSLQDDQPWIDLLGGDKILAAMLDAREQGVARYLGVSGTKPRPLIEAMQSGLFDVAMTYYEYNLLRRGALPVLREAERLKMGLINAGPLNGGLLNGDRSGEMDDRRQRRLDPALADRIEKLVDLCRDHDYSSPQLNLRFSLAAPFASTVLGMRNRVEVQAALDAVERPPPESLWTAALQLIETPSDIGVPTNA